MNVPLVPSPATKCVTRPLCLIPDFERRGVVMRAPVELVVVLVGIKIPRRALRQTGVALREWRRRTPRAVGEDQLGPYAEDSLPLRSDVRRARTTSHRIRAPRRSWRRQCRYCPMSHRGCGGPASGVRRSASQIIRLAGRSLTDPPGLCHSALAYSSTPGTSRSMRAGAPAACCRWHPEPGLRWKGEGLRRRASYPT